MSFESRHARLPSDFNHRKEAQLHRNPTITHVARLAGVSNMTVSRVLNHAAYVSPEATKRVKAAIEKLDYHPSELARSLRSQRSRTIGLIIPSLHEAPFANCAHAMAIAAKGHNYSLVVTVSGEDPNAESFEAEQLLQRGVDGVAIISARFHESRIASHLADGKPVVVFDHSLYGPAEDGESTQRNSDVQSTTWQVTGHEHLSIGIVGCNWRFYRVAGERSGYYMTVLGIGPAATALAGSAPHERNATRGFGAKGLIETATFFSSSAEPIRKSVGELRAMETPLAQSHSCHKAQVSCIRLAETCESAQEMGKVAAGLLFGRIEQQSLSRRRA